MNLDEVLVMYIHGYTKYNWAFLLVFSEKQGCQLSRIRRETRAFRVNLPQVSASLIFLTHISRILHHHGWEK